MSNEATIRDARVERLSADLRRAMQAIEPRVRDLQVSPDARTGRVVLWSADEAYEETLTVIEVERLIADLRRAMQAIEQAL